MVMGWRKAFCTSAPRDRDGGESIKEKQDRSAGDSDRSPRLCIKLNFFSNQSTPRSKAPTVSSPTLRCRTTTATQSVPASPKLQCKAKTSPGFFNRSNSPSPRSPSTFSLLKSSLYLNRSRCGICLQSVKTGQGTAIFTAECSHSFHFPCIVKNRCGLACPVCSTQWSELPVLAVDEKTVKDEKHCARSPWKIYNDDEPLMSPTSGVRFNTIPESDENEDEDEENSSAMEFQGFCANSIASPILELSISKDIEIKLSPEAAVISTGRGYVTYAVVLKVRAPPATARRSPIDLVTVLDVTGGTTAEKVNMTKRAMKLVLSSLSSSDRLSIVAFSGSSKRLLPLRRMTSTGRISARRIVDALVACQGTSSVSDALKKAMKVLEDRRDKNPVASIILLSDGHGARKSPVVSTTRFPNLEIPVHSVRFTQSDDALNKCFKSLLNVVVEDLRLQLRFVAGSPPAEIAAVYSYTGRPGYLGSGSCRFGDFFAGEEKEAIVELKVPSSTIGAHRILSVGCFSKEIYAKEQALTVPIPYAVRSSNPCILRLRNIFVTTRAVAESRRLIERNDLNGAVHMITSGRALLLQWKSSSANEFIRSLEAELAEIQQRKEKESQRLQQNGSTEWVKRLAAEKSEPSTPTSAWKTAERLAKVAMTRKSMNKVGDLHGFEDARF